ncbi:MAG: CHAD domain-containing protein [Vicinamibacterales bacterium]
MGYRFKPGRRIEAEVHRIASKQLETAIAGLRAVGTPERDAAVHDARRRVKKVRALLRLVDPALEEPARRSHARLRTANRLVAPIGDAEALVATVDLLGKRFQRDLDPSTIQKARGLLVARWSRIDEQADADAVLEACAALLRTEQKRVKRWTLRHGGLRAIAPGLEASIRRSRRAMRLAIVHPTSDRYHRWRRRVKDHWLQMRLIDGRCGARLRTDTNLLERLDGYLGEHHNCAMLEAVLVADPGVLPEPDAARLLRLVRRYRHDLERKAIRDGQRLYRHAPRTSVERVRRAWHAARLAQAPAADPVPPAQARASSAARSAAQPSPASIVEPPQEGAPWAVTG